MTAQPGLFDRPLFTLGACVFGPGDPAWLGPHHCAACAAEVDQASAWCAGEVAAGRYDASLYTPAEARAARKAGRYVPAPRRLA